MKRREFIAFVGGAAAWPLIAHAQQPSVPIIGFLGAGSPELLRKPIASFHDWLKEEGYVAGQNVVIEYRWASGEYDRLPALTAELLAEDVRVIAALSGAQSGLAAKAATKSVPIVFAI